jgi:hypothetical protein
MVPLKPPPRDTDGIVVPHDSEEILASDGVIRRVSITYHVIRDKSGAPRLSSMAFKPSTDRYGGLSVDLLAQIVELGHDPRAYVTNPTFMGSVIFRAEDVRKLGLCVGSDPCPDNKAHGQVWGISTKSVQRGLQGLAEWFVAIPNVALK